MIRTALSLLTWFAFLVAALALLARFVPAVDHTILIISALSPYLLLGAGTPAVLLLLSRRSWWAVSVAVMLAAGAAFAVLPRFVASGPAAPDAVPIRVLTANLWEGSADPRGADRDGPRTHRPRRRPGTDTGVRPRSQRSGVGIPLPGGELRAGAAGAGIWSRYPIVGSRRDSAYQLSMLSATLRVPGAASDTLVVAAHIVGPWPNPIDDWRREMAKLPGTLRTAAEVADPEL